MTFAGNGIILLIESEGKQGGGYLTAWAGLKPEDVSPGGIETGQYTTNQGNTQVEQHTTIHRPFKSGCFQTKVKGGKLCIYVIVILFQQEEIFL